MNDPLQIPDFEFPKDFLWGSATAAHQIEGNNIHSNFWKREQSGGIWSQWDVEETSGRACNNWELFREDVALLGELGHQAYRFSIEWSRIQPGPDVWCEEAVDHYVELLDLLNEAGIKPVVTLHHFTHPQWFEDLGEFSREENIAHFLRYVERLLPRIVNKVHLWTTFNEFNRGGYFGSPRKLHILRAHAEVYRMIKARSDASVSVAHAMAKFHPARATDSFDRVMCGLLDHITNEFFFHAIRSGEFVYPDSDAVEVPGLKGAADFWGVNFYTREIVDSRKKSCHGDVFPHLRMRLIDKRFYLEEFHAESLTESLERLKDKPVYLTENGCSAIDDRYRIIFLAEYLNAVHRAISLGVDVRGYFYWSTMDNYEWGSYKPRFGLVAVDRKTFARTPKPSAAFFREVIGNNAFSQSRLRHFVPVLPSAACEPAVAGSP